jgi:hypothetical protein
VKLPQVAKLNLATNCTGMIAGETQTRHYRKALLCSLALFAAPWFSPPVCAGKTAEAIAAGLVGAAIVAAASKHHRHNKRYYYAGHEHYPDDG